MPYRAIILPCLFPCGFLVVYICLLYFCTFLLFSEARSRLAQLLRQLELAKAAAQRSESLLRDEIKKEQIAKNDKNKLTNFGLLRFEQTSMFGFLGDIYPIWYIGLDSERR